MRLIFSIFSFLLLELGLFGTPSHLYSIKESTPPIKSGYLPHGHYGYSFSLDEFTTAVWDSTHCELHGIWDKAQTSGRAPLMDLFPYSKVFHQGTKKTPWNVASKGDSTAFHSTTFSITSIVREAIEIQCTLTSPTKTSQKLHIRDFLSLDSHYGAPSIYRDIHVQGLLPKDTLSLHLGTSNVPIDWSFGAGKATLIHPTSSQAILKIFANGIVRIKMTWIEPSSK